MKSLKFILIVAVLFLNIADGFAQLNGTYTIGGTTPDFATPQDAVTALQSTGINGPVVFNIRPGIYNGKVDLGAVPGNSSVNTILFKSENNDSTSVIITDSASATGSNFTFHIFGTDYVTLKHLTITRPGTNVNAMVISLGSNPKRFKLLNCVIESNTTNTTNVANCLVNYPLGNVNDSSMVISGNVFRGGAFGLYFKGQSAVSQIPLIEITNNHFINQSFRAIYLYYHNSPIISGNSVITSSTSTTYRSFYLQRATGPFTISKNKIEGISAGGNAMHFDTCTAVNGNPAVISNNFIQTQGAGNTRGIFVSQCSYLSFYYNTIHISSTNVNAAAFYINDAGSSTQLNLKNNIMVNSGGGITYRVPAGARSSLASSDYNDLYVPPSSAALAYLDTGNLPDLATWQLASSLDSNSVSGDPQFTSATDLHVDNPVVNDIALVIAGITTDIDGDVRSLSTPDIGADEFTPLNDNLGLIAFVTPVSGTCGDSVVTVGVVIHNFGLDDQSGFSVSADITGTLTQMLTENFTGTISTNEDDTLYFSQTLNTYDGDSIYIIAYSSLGADQYKDNDTIQATFFFAGHPDAPNIPTPQQVCDNNAIITGVPDSGNVLMWFDQPVGGNLLFTGNTFNPVLTSDTAFYVEARTGSGSSGCLRITEIQPDVTPDFIEIQNISNVGFDATGWKVYASQNNNDINVVNNSSWSLGYFNPGEVQYRTDGTTDNYWGSNLDWTGGFGSWAIIVDDMGNIADFVVWDWDSATIQSMNITVGSFNLTPGTEWDGDGYTSCSSSTISNQRGGSDDHNDPSDWSCDSPSKGIANTNLASAFNNCGVGLCGSPRVRVDVTIVAGITPVNLGNDTSFSGPFSLILDADTGYTSYLWSTGDTTQTITVNTFDTYWVTVTGGVNGCSYTDSIVVTSTVGIFEMIGSEKFILYPNPAMNNLEISGNPDLLKDATINITDLQGRTTSNIHINSNGGDQVTIDISNLVGGVYFLNIISGEKYGVQKFVVIK